MARRKSRNFDWMPDVSIQQILWHPAIWFFAATATLIFGATHIWQSQSSTLINQGEYLLTPERIQVTSQNNHYKMDPKQLLVSQFAKQPSLLDVDLVPRVAKTFQSIPWVETVHRVEKVKSGLEVDLDFRRPVAEVAMVVQNRDQPVHVVDRKGVVLDQRLLNLTSDSLLRINVFKPNLDALEAWQVWQDRRVIEAAAICESLKNYWKDWGVYRVFTMQRTPDAIENRNFELMTRNGVKIVWGNATGHEAYGEVDAAKKLEAINKFIVEYGPLDSLARNKKIDVRSGTAIVLDDHLTASNSDWLNELK